MKVMLSKYMKEKEKRQVLIRRLFDLLKERMKILNSDYVTKI
jgi:hypothetical protein